MQSGKRRVTYIATGGERKLRAGATVSSRRLWPGLLCEEPAQLWPPQPSCQERHHEAGGWSCADAAGTLGSWAPGGCSAPGCSVLQVLQGPGSLPPPSHALPQCASVGQPRQAGVALRHVLAAASVTWHAAAVHAQAANARATRAEGLVPADRHRRQLVGMARPDGRPAARRARGRRRHGPGSSRGRGRGRTRARRAPPRQRSQCPHGAARPSWRASRHGRLHPR